MSNYDDSNSGVMFQPFEDQRMVLQGKVQIEGAERRIIAVKMPLKKGGDPVLVVYQQAGILYPNDKKGNEKAPDYSGPIDDRQDLRWAGWKGEKDGRHYLSMKVSPKQSDAQETPRSNGAGHSDLDDEIPF